MIGVVGQPLTLPTFALRDGTGALVTGKTTNQWTKKVKRNGAASNVTLTIAEDIGDPGYYAPSLTPDAAGTWTALWEITIGDLIRRYSEPFEVITAAQADPAAALAPDVEEIKAKTDVLGTGRQVVVTSPVSADAQTLTLVQGDDATLTFTEPSSGPAWPALTGLTPLLVITDRVNAAVLSVSGTVDVATGDAKQVSFALTDAQTAALAVGNPAYRFAVHLPTIDRTLVLGKVVVRRDASP